MSISLIRRVFPFKERGAGDGIRTRTSGIYYRCSTVEQLDRPTRFPMLARNVRGAERRARHQTLAGRQLRLPDSGATSPAGRISENKTAPEVFAKASGAVSIAMMENS